MWQIPKILGSSTLAELSFHTTEIAIIIEARNCEICSSHDRHGPFGYDAMYFMGRPTPYTYIHISSQLHNAASRKNVIFNCGSTVNTSKFSWAPKHPSEANAAPLGIRLALHSLNPQQSYNL
jgi:hypothetical protein